MHVLGLPPFSTTPGQLVLSSLLPDHSLLPSCFALTLSLFPQTSYSQSYQHGDSLRESWGPPIESLMELVQFGAWASGFLNIPGGVLTCNSH